jgi:antitoxin MazE
MIVEFRKWGNSLAVRIPKSYANAIHASDGKRVELTIKNGALTPSC